MMPRTSELPGDLDPEELNEMIRDLGHEIGCPDWVYPPDLVKLDVDPEVIVGGYNRGCTPSGVERYREGQRWRRKLIAELKRRPDWIREWRAAGEVDRRVEALCERKGLRFAPYECPPWWIRVDTELLPPNGTDEIWEESARLAQRLRRELEAELAAEDDAAAS
jgi:hypothetical protein